MVLYSLYSLVVLLPPDQHPSLDGHRSPPAPTRFADSIQRAPARPAAAVVPVGPPCAETLHVAGATARLARPLVPRCGLRGEHGVRVEKSGHPRHALDCRCDRRVVRKGTRNRESLSRYSPPSHSLVCRMLRMLRRRASEGRAPKTRAHFEFLVNSGTDEFDTAGHTSSLVRSTNRMK